MQECKGRGEREEKDGLTRQLDRGQRTINTKDTQRAFS